MQNVPILIRPHLVPFFFKESEGKEYFYLNKRVKTVLFSPTISTVGRIIRLLMVKSEKPVNIDNYNLCLTVSDNAGSKKYTGQFYKNEKGTNSFLMLPKEANEDINDFLEDMFRMSFVSYMNGCVENNDEAVIRAAINKFIDKYELLEFDFSNDTLRQLYYREKKNNKILARFQTKHTDQLLNFKQ